MTNERPHAGEIPGEEPSHGAGMPGDGAGRREDPGRTGVHPASAGWPEGEMEIVREGEWGQGERGLGGYEDHGESELSLPPSAPPAEGGRDVGSDASGQPDASAENG
jgi:hypothetical protein